MDASEISNALDYYASLPRSFTLQELLEFTEPPIDSEAFRSDLLADKRFITLEQGTLDENHFIPERTLFSWFVYLSLRLASAHRARLTSRQLARSMSSLQLDERWDTPPSGAIQFGRSFGFVAPAWTPSEYIFPFARILSFLSSPIVNVAGTIFRSFSEKEVRDRALKRPMKVWVEEGFANFDKRVARVVRARRGLLMNNSKTLKQIGLDEGVSRERVRQLEKNFWEQVHHPRCMIPFLKALICDIITTKGCLIIFTRSPDASLKRFIAECTGVPQIELPHAGLVVLGATSEDSALLESLRLLRGNVTVDAIATRLGLESGLCLSDTELKLISARITAFCRKHLNKAQKVYFSLCTIGRPAHYSEVAEVYNRMFPDDPCTEHNVHAHLGREQHGVIWIGVKGTFALKEWGYERPAKTLFESVEEIVRKFYKRTLRPVPFTVIQAEIGKYRKRVKLSSLIMAAQLNPQLRCTSKDFFVPK